MKRIKYLLLALSLTVTGIHLPAAASENVSQETQEQSQASDKGDEPSSRDTEEGEAATEETELLPVLLETDKVTTDDILLYSASCVVMDT